MADEQVGQLTGAVARLEEAHQQRERWRTLTARLHQQAQAALVELEARHDARNSATRADATLAGLRRRLAHAEGRLDSMEATVHHLYALARRCRDQADQLAAQLAVLVAAPPAIGRTRLILADEQATATQIDHLRQALTDTRLGLHVARGRSRETLRTELEELVSRHPALVRPEQRQQRWDTMITDARGADRDQASILRSQINQAKTEAAEHTTVAKACRVEGDLRAKTVNTIAIQIASRSGGCGRATDFSRPRPVTDVNVSADTAVQSPPTKTGPDIHHHTAAVDPPALDGPTLKA